MAQIEAMNRANDAAMKAQMKQMGMDPSEFGIGGGYDDPELAELDRMMRKQGK